MVEISKTADEYRSTSAQIFQTPLLRTKYIALLQLLAAKRSARRTQWCMETILTTFLYV